MASILGDLMLRLRANSADLQKGVETSKKSVKGLDSTVAKTSKNVSNTTKKMQKTAGGAFSSMAASMSGFGPAGRLAAGGLQKMAGSAAVLNVALGPIGLILAAVALAVKSLASYFKGSVDGAEKFASIMGFIKGIMAGVQDLFIKAGRALTKAFEDPKQAVQDLWAAIQENFVNRFQGLLQFFESAFSVLSNGFKGLAKLVKSVFDDTAREEANAFFEAMKADLVETGKAAVKMTTGLDAEKIVQKTRNAIAEVAEVTRITQALAEREFQLRLKLLEVSRFESKSRREIADLIRISKDIENKAFGERERALIEAEKIELNIADTKISAQEEAVALQREANDATESSVEDIEKLVSLENELDRLYIDRDNKVREIVNRQNELYVQQKKYIDVLGPAYLEMTKNEAEAAYAVAIDKQKADAEALKAIQTQREAAEDSWKDYQLSKNDETHAGRLTNLKTELDSGLILQEEYNARLLDLDKQRAEEQAQIDADAAEKRQNAADEEQDDRMKKWEAWKSTATTAIQVVGDLFAAIQNKQLKDAEGNEKKQAEIRKKWARRQKAFAIAQAIINGALAITKTFSQTGVLGFAAVAPVIATTAASIALIASQSFADGGIVSGPVNALVGEYPGARSNPEVIAPLDKLQNIISAQLGAGEVEFRIRGTDLVGVLGKAERSYATI